MRKHIYLFAALILASQLSAQVGYTANDQVPDFDVPFRVGVNPSFHNTDWTDEKLADIAAGNAALGLPGAGMKAFRVPLPELFLEFFGYDIRVPAFEHYADLGMGEHTVFLETPSVEHRDQTEYCPGDNSRLFANMYLPIYDGGANGTPYNDDNYAARYVYETVSQYKDHVRVWEIWNEPDFDTSNNAWLGEDEPGNWYDNVPDPCDYKLKAPVYHYIRLLRISYEMAKLADPGALVAIGGVGYESFLDIVLRHTDNPDGGAVSAEFPLTGGAYFDVLSYHSYPHYDGSVRYWNNAINNFTYTRHSDAAVAGTYALGQNLADRLTQYGYDGTTYPRKHLIVTEANIPRKSFGEFMGSDAAQRNYAMKMQVEAYAKELRQLHFYDLADATSYEGANSWLDMTGLYQQISNTQPYTATINESGIGCRTTTEVLWGLEYDEAATQALNLPTNVGGAAFVDAQGKHTFALWARTATDRSEAAEAEITIPASFDYTSLLQRRWDWSKSGQEAYVALDQIPLTGSVVFLTGSDAPVGTETPAWVRSLKIGPNPTESELQVSLTLEKAITMSGTICAVDGRELWRKSALNFAEGTQTLTIAVGKWAAGTYVLTLTTAAGESISRSFIRG